MNSTPRADAAKPLRLDLHGAYIPKTQWRGSNLTRANLAGADCTGADLSEAILRQANLIGTNFVRANLRGADLQDARMAGACLRGADLTDARNFTHEQLREAIVDETTILPAQLILSPAK